MQFLDSMSLLFAVSSILAFGDWFLMRFFTLRTNSLISFLLRQLLHTSSVMLFPRNKAENIFQGQLNMRHINLPIGISHLYFKSTISLYGSNIKKSTY